MMRELARTGYTFGTMGGTRVTAAQLCRSLKAIVRIVARPTGAGA